MRVSKMVTAVDAHAGGEPGRVIVGGVMDVPGETMFEKKIWLERNRDDLRRRMLREPRGYPALCCNVILPPTHPDADAGFVIMEHTEYPAMSGSNTICVATVLIETGMVAASEPVTELVLEAPAGLIRVRADVEGGKVTLVTFRNVPAFALHLDAVVDVPGLGRVTVDVGFGGMFYVIADAAQFGIELLPENGGQITRVGEMLRVAAAEQLSCVHPTNPEVSGVSISQLSGPPIGDAHRRNAVTVSTGRPSWDRPESWKGCLDRSPCGTGTCAKMAVLHAKGELALGEEFRHESIIGTVWTGKLIEETEVGGVPAVVPTLSGTAWITGIAQYVVDDTDPFPEGFTVGDIWAE